MNEERLHKLWENTGRLNSKFTIDYETFKNDMNDIEKRHRFYESVRKLNPKFTVTAEQADIDLGFTSEQLSVVGDDSVVEPETNANSKKRDGYQTMIDSHTSFAEKHIKEQEEKKAQQAKVQDNYLNAGLSEQDKTDRAEYEKLMSDKAMNQISETFGVELPKTNQYGMPVVEPSKEEADLTTISRPRTVGTGDEVIPFKSSEQKVDEKIAAMPSYITRGEDDTHKINANAFERALNTKEGKELYKQIFDNEAFLFKHSNEGMALLEQYRNGEISEEDFERIFREKVGPTIDEEFLGEITSEGGIMRDYFVVAREKLGKDISKKGANAVDYAIQEYELEKEKEFDNKVREAYKKIYGVYPEDDKSVRYNAANDGLLFRWRRLEDIKSNVREQEQIGYRTSEITGETKKYRKDLPQILQISGAKEFNEDAKEIIDAVENKGLGDFFKAFGRTASDMDTWDLGISTLLRNGAFLEVVEKADRKEELTREEQLLMDAALNYMAVSAFYSNSLGRGYKAGTTSAASIPFMIQFALSAGALSAMEASLTGSAKAAGTKLINALAKHGMQNMANVAASEATKAIGKASAGMLSSLIGAGALTAAWDIPSIASGSIERQIGDITPVYDEEGNAFVYGGSEYKQSPKEATWNAFADKYVERLSEMVLAKTFAPIEAYASGTRMFKSIAKNDVIGAILDIRNTPFIKGLREKAMFGGLFEEMMEEELGGLLRMATMSDVNTFKEAGLDMDGQIDIFLGLAPTSLLFSVGGTASHYGKLAVRSKKLRDSLVTDAERKLFDNLMSESRSGKFGELAHDFIRNVILADRTKDGRKITNEDKRDALITVLTKYQDVLSEELQKQTKAVKKEENDAAIDNAVQNMRYKETDDIFFVKDENGKKYVIVDGNVGFNQIQGGLVVDSSRSDSHVSVREVLGNGRLGKVEKVRTASLTDNVHPMSTKTYTEWNQAKHQAEVDEKETFEYNGIVFDTATSKRLGTKEEYEKKKKEDEAVKNEGKPTINTEPRKMKNEKFQLVVDGKKQTVTFYNAGLVQNEDGSINKEDSDLFIIEVNGEKVSRRNQEEYIDALSEHLKSEHAKAIEEYNQKQNASDNVEPEAPTTALTDEDRAAAAAEQERKAKEAEKQSVLASAQQKKAKKYTPEEAVVVLMEQGNDVATRLVGSRINKLRTQIDEINADENKDELEKWEDSKELSDQLAEYEAAVIKWLGQETLDAINATRVAPAAPVEEGPAVPQEQAQAVEPAQVETPAKPVASEQETPQDDVPAEPDTTPLPPAEPVDTRTKIIDVKQDMADGKIKSYYSVNGGGQWYVVKDGAIVARSEKANKGDMPNNATEVNASIVYKDENGIKKPVILITTVDDYHNLRKKDAVIIDEYGLTTADTQSLYDSEVKIDENTGEEIEDFIQINQNTSESKKEREEIKKYTTLDSLLGFPLLRFRGNEVFTMKDLLELGYRTGSRKTVAKQKDGSRKPINKSVLYSPYDLVKGMLKEKYPNDTDVEIQKRMNHFANQFQRAAVRWNELVASKHAGIEILSIDNVNIQTSSTGDHQTAIAQFMMAASEAVANGIITTEVSEKVDTLPKKFNPEQKDRIISNRTNEEILDDVQQLEQEIKNLEKLSEFEDTKKDIAAAKRKLNNLIKALSDSQAQFLSEQYRYGYVAESLKKRMASKEQQEVDAPAGEEGDTTKETPAKRKTNIDSLRDTFVEAYARTQNQSYNALQKTMAKTAFKGMIDKMSEEDAIVLYYNLSMESAKSQGKMVDDMANAAQALLDSKHGAAITGGAQQETNQTPVEATEETTGEEEQTAEDDIDYEALVAERNELQETIYDMEDDEAANANARINEINEILRNRAEFMVGQENTQPLTEAEDLSLAAALQSTNGMVQTISREEAQAEYERQKSANSVRLMLQMLEQGTKGLASQPISGAKVQKNLETTKQKYQNSDISAKNAIMDIAKAIGAKNTGTSNYITIEAENGVIFTLRLSNHNATVANFDNNNETNGISIVISRHANEGIQNNGSAHIVEYFYSDKQLSSSNITPIADIIESLEQTMYSGEYKDKTGFAQVQEVNAPETDGSAFSIRSKPAPIKTGIGYKVFFRGKDGKLYPPMVANPNGADTPIGVWLDADAAPVASESKTGRPQVKAGGKGTQGGSGSLAYRPGWHLGEIPYALQFNRKDEKGERTLFPKDFVWAEVEYADDVNYQEEAESYGYTENGKYRHSYAGLPRVPENGSYRYRTNPNPQTDPWIITGAMKVNRILTNEEVDDLVRQAGREPQQREFFKDGDDILGYAQDGKIYLTPAGMNAETVIHEYTHIWAKALQQNNHKAWKSIVDTLKNCKELWNEVLNDPNYESIKNDEDAVASEVLSRYSGKRGAERLKADAERVISEKKGMEKDIKVNSLIARVRKALTEFWSWVGKNLFEIESFSNIDEIADRTLYDMLNNTQLNLDNSKKSSTFAQNNENYERTDEFRELQERSNSLPESTIAEYHSEEREFSDEDRRRVGGVFQRLMESERNGGRNGQWINLIGKGNKFKMAQVNPAIFHDIFQICRNYLPNGELVDLHDNYADCKCFISEDGLCGFAVEPNGNLISVFSLNPSYKKGFLYAIKDLIRQEGATHLDCYVSNKQPLAEIYQKALGFHVASEMDYNMEYDHDNIAENHGMPKIAFMVDKPTEKRKFDGESYDAAYDYQQSQTSTAEREQIIAEAKANGTFMLAPNGQSTNLTEDMWVSVRTQAFKDWFGDWQNDPANASKVLDENGEPLVVYHGSKMAGFDEFQQLDESVNGFFTTDNKAGANTYATNREERRNNVMADEAQLNAEPHHGIYSLFANIKNPAVYDFAGKMYNEYGEPLGYYVEMSGEEWDNQPVPKFATEEEALAFARENGEPDSAVKTTYLSTDDLVEMAKAAGHDGVIFKNVLDGAEHNEEQPVMNDYIAFEPNQLKSATQNIGTFNAEDNRIEFMIAPAAPSGTPITDPTLMLDEEALKALEVKSKKYAAKLANPKVQLPEEIDGMFVARNFDRTEGIRRIMNSIAEYRKAHGMPKMGEGFDVRTMIETKDSKINNKIASFDNKQVKRLEKIVRKWTKIIEKSAMYEKYKNEQMRNQDGEVTTLTPIEFLERYLIACDSIEREALTKNPRGIGGFLSRMGINVIQFHNEFVSEFASDTNGKKMREELWEAVRGVTRVTLEVGKESGLISQEEYDKDIKRQFYVPERDFAEVEANKQLWIEGAAWRKSKRGARLRAMQKSKEQGGLSLAANILSNMLDLTYDAIAKAEENKVKVAMFDLLSANEAWCNENRVPVPVRVWYEKDVDGKPVRRTTEPSRSEREEMKKYKGEVRKLENLILNETDKKLIYESKIDELKEELKKNHTPEERLDIETDIRELETLILQINDNIDEWHEDIDVYKSMYPYMDTIDVRNILFETKEQQKAETVIAYVDGVPCEMHFPNMQIVADALNNVSYNDWYFDDIKKVTSYASAIFTVYNPTFFTVNLARDIPWIIKKGYSEYGWQFLVRFPAKLIAETFSSTLWKAVAGKDYSDSIYAEHMREFYEGGGNTGYTQLPEMQRIKKHVAKWGEKKLITWGDVGNVMSFMNEWSEVLTRSAAYSVVRDMGYNQEEGIRAAKNLSVNFNRKGLGSKFMNLFSSFSMFANAVVQGACGFYRTFNPNEDTQLQRAMHVTRAVMSIGLAPAFAGFISTLLQPDDEDDFLVSDWERDNYFILGNVRIPLSEQLKPFWCIGVNIALGMQGKRNVKDIARSLINSFFVNLVPAPNSFNSTLQMLTDAIFGYKDFSGAALVDNLLTPQVLKNTNSIANNSNFMGGKFRYDYGDVPEFAMGENDPYIYRCIAELAYNMAGGDKYVKSTSVKKVNEYGEVEYVPMSKAMNINPKQIEAWASVFVPSGFRDIANAVAVTIGKIAGDEDAKFEAKEFNSVTRFYKQQDKELNQYFLLKDIKKEIEYYNYVKSTAKKNIIGAEITGNEEWLESAETKYENVSNNTLKQIEASLIEQYDKLHMDKIARKYALTGDELKEHLSDKEIIKIDKERDNILRKILILDMDRKGDELFTYDDFEKEQKYSEEEKRDILESQIYNEVRKKRPK